MTDREQNAPWYRRAAVGEVLLAVGVVVLGGVMLWQTGEIRIAPMYAKVGPRVIPYAVAVGLIVVGVWLLIEALTGRVATPTDDAEDADPALSTDWQTVALLAAALLAYLLLIERAGFIIASAVLYAGATFAMGSRRIALNLVIGVALAVAAFLIFTEGLSIDLPLGLLDGVG